MDAQGQYYVADTGTGRVAILSPDGAIVKELKNQQDAKQPLKQPVGVGVASNGSLIVTDAETARVNWYDASQQLIKSTPVAAFDSVHCAQILVLSDNTWYQSDPNGHRLVHFDATGTPIEQIGSAADLGGPMAMALDPAGRIYVADPANRQVAVFAPT